MFYLRLKMRYHRMMFRINAKLFGLYHKRTWKHVKAVNKTFEQMITARVKGFFAEFFTHPPELTGEQFLENLKKQVAVFKERKGEVQ